MFFFFPTSYSMARQAGDVAGELEGWGLPLLPAPGDCSWGSHQQHPCAPHSYGPPNRSSSPKRRSVIWAPIHNETQSEQGFRVRGCPRAASFIKSWMWILSLEGTHVPWTGDGWSVAWVAIMMCWLPSLDCCWGVSSLPPKLEELKCHHLAALSGATPCI